MKTRVAASIALAAALMLGATGCTFASNIATEKPYDPSDGVGAQVGELSIRNALLIGDDPDQLNLVMTVVSAADSDRRLTVQWQAEGERVTDEIFVNANGRTTFGGPEDDQVLITASGATIGGLVPVFFAYPGAEGVEVLIPVLDGSLPEYELYIP